MLRKLTWIGQRFTSSSYQLKTDQHPRQTGHFASLQAKKKERKENNNEEVYKGNIWFHIQRP